jgi:hypothetical protein
MGGGLALMSAAIPETGLVIHTQFLAHDFDTGIRAVDIEEVIGLYANEWGVRVRMRGG